MTYFEGLRTIEDSKVSQTAWYKLSMKTYKKLLASGMSVYQAQKELARRLGHGRVEVCRIYLESLDY